MFKVTWKYSLLCGVFLIVLYHLSAYFGINPLINIGHLLFDILIFGLFIFFASKEYKSYHNNGILHFWQGMTIGFTVYSLGSLLFAVGLIIYFYFDDLALIKYQEAATGFLNERAEIYQEQFGEEGFTQQLHEIEQITIRDLVFSSTIKKLFAGFFITPVISIILRKQPKKQ